MKSFHFSDNIAGLRREKRITQEQLADFLGVTKASVSKWETGQSMPDVVLLPQIASFFDVTIDELLGYEPQLGREQIQKLYLDLSSAFAAEPFEKVMEKSRSLVKQYYSCYPFLYNIAGLWMNHYMLAEQEEQGRKILEEAAGLCEHIMKNSKDIGLCSDAMIQNAVIQLMMGKPREVVEILEEINNPCRLSLQSEGILIQAYQLLGDKEKANSFTQIAMYRHLMSLIGDATQYIAVHAGDISVCEETVRRIEPVAQAYKVEKLNPNTIALFYYQAASVFCSHGRKKEAAGYLERFVEYVEQLLCEGNLKLCGDEYFDRLEIWLEELALKGEAPRDKKVIYESLAEAVSAPVFTALESEETYQKLKKTVIRIGEKL